MNFIQILLITYLVILPLFTLFLVSEAVKFKYANGYLCELSGFGEEKYKYNKVVNILFPVLQIPALISVNMLADYLPQDAPTTIGIYSFYLISLSAILIAIFRRDKYRKTHVYAGIPMLLGAILTMSLLIFPFLNSPEIPNILAYINIAILLVVVTYTILKVYFIVKGGVVNKNEKDLSYWEWSGILLVLLWSWITTFIVVRGSF